MSVEREFGFGIYVVCQCEVSYFPLIHAKKPLQFRLGACGPKAQP